LDETFSGYGRERESSIPAGFVLKTGIERIAGRRKRRWEDKIKIRWMEMF
jgi:hypothetical protein